MKLILALLGAAALQFGLVTGAGAKEIHPGWEETNDYFADEVWTKVLSRTCLKCHKTGGDAEESEFILRDPRRVESPAEAQTYNRKLFAKIAGLKKDGKPVILRKVVGDLEGYRHAGDISGQIIAVR